MSRRFGIALTAAALSVTLGILIGVVISIGSRVRWSAALGPGPLDRAFGSTSVPLPSDPSPLPPANPTGPPSSSVAEGPAPSGPLTGAGSQTFLAPPAANPSGVLAVAGTSKRMTAMPGTSALSSGPTAPPTLSAGTGTSGATNTPGAPVSKVPSAPAVIITLGTAPPGTAPPGTSTPSTSTPSTSTHSMPTHSMPTPSRAPATGPVTAGPPPVPVVRVGSCAALGMRTALADGTTAFCQSGLVRGSLQWRPVVSGGGCLNRSMTGVSPGRRFACRRAVDGLNYWVAIG